MKKSFTRILLLLLICFGLAARSYAQNEVIINLAPIDGIDITPDNFLNYQIQSNLNRSSRSMIRGTIRYKGSDLLISYQFIYDLAPGINQMSSAMIRPQMTYSNSALKELFEYYKKLPEGIYEYCVSVQTDYQTEGASQPYTECLYHRSDDIFLINLVDPPDNARIYEYNPMLSWVVNYPFANELSYRLRVAEVKKGQNNTTAISRNNAVFDQKDIRQMSLLYPVYARPLQKDQPYAWTVDAYYKGILLGSAEAWRFTIIEDSILSKVPSDQSYFEFAGHDGETRIYAIDTLKLKYQSYSENDTLHLTLTDEKDKEIKLRPDYYKMKPGLNYLDISLDGKLVHEKQYRMQIVSESGKKYIVPFMYINPLYLKK